MNPGSEATKPSAALVVTRAERRRREAVDRVFKVATHLFAERGYAETSMAAIAEAADVSVGTLYNLFDNKDALYLELVRGEAQLFRDRLVPIFGSGLPLDQVVDRFVEVLLDLFRKEATTIRLYWRVSAQARISFRATLAEPIRAMYDETVAAFARAIATGRDGEATPQAYRTALCCQALLGELFYLHVDDPKKNPADSVLAEAKRMMRAVLSPITEVKNEERKRR